MDADPRLWHVNRTKPDGSEEVNRAFILNRHVVDIPLQNVLALWELRA